MSSTPAHWGTLGLKGFFLTFFGFLPGGAKNVIFFVFGTLFEISKLIRVRFGSQNGVPEGTFWRFLGEVARVEILDSFFVVFSTKTANTQKVKTSIFTAMRSVSWGSQVWKKRAVLDKHASFFFIFFLSKIGPKSKKLARKTVIEVKVGRKSFRGPSLNVHFQARERF